MEIEYNVNYRQHKHNNKWEYRIRFTDPFTEKPAEKSKRGFRTKAEAKAAAKTKMKELDNGIITTDTQLSPFLDFWLENYKQVKVRKNTVISLKNSIEKHIKPYFKNIKIKNVTHSMYQEFIVYLSEEKELAKNSILNIHTAMYGAMKRAKINKIIPENPCEDVVIPSDKKKKKDDQNFIDSSEVAAFLSHAYDYGYIYWIFFKVMIDTGMRKGEVAALQWSDIDLKNRTIDINKTLDFQAKNPKDPDELFGDPKTFNSPRIIDISNTLASELRFHLNWQNQNKQNLNKIYNHDLNLVLCKNDGNYMPKSTLFNAFKRILKKSGIKQLPIHSLRHTHVVLQLEAGSDLKYIQERLGHGSYAITMDVYAHVSNKMKKRDTNKYDEYMASILK